jgi:hypothetical protein
VNACLWANTAAITSIKVYLTGAGHFIDGTVVNLYGLGGSTAIGATGATGTTGATGATGSAPTPQGRLTLQTGVAVQTSDQTAKTTVYYDSYVGNLVPVWNGSAMVSLAIGSDEISMGLDTTRVASGSVYDIYGLSNSGTLAIAVGPAWSSTTSRGTGAGTTELQLKNGVWTNKNALTHAYGGSTGGTDYGSISANQATYLGTLYATANGQTGISLRPASATGGSNTFVGLWNAYNAVGASARSQDYGNTSSGNWTMSSQTWRAQNASNSNRVTFVTGLQTNLITGINQQTMDGGSNSVVGIVGVNLDSTSAIPGVVALGGNTINTAVYTTTKETFYPVLGLHYIQAMEASLAGGTVTFSGGSLTGGWFNTLTVDLWI